ncbi:MAG: Nif11-like leader peptide family natural product precursor [Hydrogeniiclostridium mannosilyticum]
MSKENMKRFLEKAAATPALAEKLDAAQKEYEEKFVTLARETGFEITQEDVKRR